MAGYQSSGVCGTESSEYTWRTYGTKSFIDTTGSGGATRRLGVDGCFRGREEPHEDHDEERMADLARMPAITSITMKPSNSSIASVR